MIKVTIKDKTGTSMFTCNTEAEATAVIEVVSSLTDVIESKTETTIKDGTRKTKYTYKKKQPVPVGQVQIQTRSAEKASTTEKPVVSGSSYPRT